MLTALGALAKEIGYTQAQLCLAWAIASKDVSTCILGFSKLEQVDENLKSLELYRNWTDELEKKCEAILGNAPEVDIDFRTWAPSKPRRALALQKSLL